MRHSFAVAESRFSQKEAEDREYEDLGDEDDRTDHGRRVRRMRKKRHDHHPSSSSAAAAVTAASASRTKGDDSDETETESESSSSTVKGKAKTTSSSSSSSTGSSSNGASGSRIRRRDRHHSFGALTALAAKRGESDGRRRGGAGHLHQDCKAVRFADSLGLDLVKIKFYDAAAQQQQEQASFAFVPVVARSPQRTLVPLFQQPGSRADFLALVGAQRVREGNVQQ